MNLTHTPATGFTLALAIGAIVFVIVVLGGVYAAGVAAQPKQVMAETSEQEIR